jgi:hypothetical protein
MVLITYGTTLIQVQKQKYQMSDLKTYSRLQIDEDGSGDIVLIVCLIEEDVLPIATFRSPFF